MQNDSKDIFNVIVIGSGPSGCASAIYAAKHGMSVCMVEARSEATQKPGESFHPGIFSLLKILGVDDKVGSAGFLRYTGHFVNWGRNNSFKPFGEDSRGVWEGIHAPRKRFEEILMAEAKAQGVIIKCPCRAISVILDHERIVGVNSSSGPIYCKWIIDATGDKNWLSRVHSLPIHFESNKLIAFYGYTDTRGMANELSSSLEARKKGWSWTARIDANRFAWTTLLFGQAYSQSDLIPSRLRQCNPVSRTKGRDVTWRIVANSAGPGYFIVGDAAALLDPLSSDGVVRALLSGIFASHCIYQILHGKNTESFTILHYRDWIYRLFCEKANTLKSFYNDLFLTNHITP